MAILLLPMRIWSMKDYYRHLLFLLRTIGIGKSLPQHAALFRNNNFRYRCKLCWEYQDKSPCWLVLQVERRQRVTIVKPGDTHVLRDNHCEQPEYKFWTLWSYLNHRLLYLDSQGWYGPTSYIQIRNFDKFNSEEPWETVEGWITNELHYFVGITLIRRELMTEINLH